MWHGYYETPSSWTWFHVGCWAGVFAFTKKITKIQLRWLKEVKMGGIFQWINRATSTWKCIMFLLHTISHSQCVSVKVYNVLDIYNIILTGPHITSVMLYEAKTLYTFSSTKNYWIFREYHKCVFLPLTWIVGSSINLISETHNSVRRGSTHL